MRKIDDLLKKKVITAQRHWFIVYKVFKEKKWLKKETNRAFIEQMNSLFAPNLRCSSEDFKKIDRYFKDKNYEEWSLEDWTDIPQEYPPKTLSLSPTSTKRSCEGFFMPPSLEIQVILPSASARLGC